MFYSWIFMQFTVWYNLLFQNWKFLQSVETFLESIFQILESLHFPLKRDEHQPLRPQSIFRSSKISKIKHFRFLDHSIIKYFFGAMSVSNKPSYRNWDRFIRNSHCSEKMFYNWVTESQVLTFATLLLFIEWLSWSWIWLFNFDIVVRSTASHNRVVTLNKKSAYTFRQIFYAYTNCKLTVVI